MNGLDMWFATQQDRLDAGLWLNLALRTARVDALLTAEHFSAAERALPSLYRTIDEHHLPEWRIFLQLTESALVLASSGDLNRALDLAINGLTTAETLPGVDHEALKNAARLSLMRCWMKVDEVGYAPDVLAIGEEALSGDSTGDWAYWFQATNAWALWALGRYDEANDHLSAMLEELPRLASRADLLEGQAYIAYRMGRQSQSAELYAQAASAFEAERLAYSAVRCLLNRALCLHEVGEFAASGCLLDHIIVRARSLTGRHYLGLAYCFRGRNSLALGASDLALADLNRADLLYEGRGWWRDEAQIAIHRLEAMRGLGAHPDWSQAIERAHSALGRLRSTDLRARLDRILNPA